jgi:hypothetical protein
MVEDAERILTAARTLFANGFDRPADPVERFPPPVEGMAPGDANDSSDDVGTEVPLEEEHMENGLEPGVDENEDEEESDVNTEVMEEDEEEEEEGAGTEESTTQTWVRIAGFHRPRPPIILPETYPEDVQRGYHPQGFSYQRPPLSERSVDAPGQES